MRDLPKRELLLRNNIRVALRQDGLVEGRVADDLRRVVVGLVLEASDRVRRLANYKVIKWSTHPGNLAPRVEVKDVEYSGAAAMPFSSPAMQAPLSRASAFTSFRSLGSFLAKLSTSWMHWSRSRPVKPSIVGRSMPKSKSRSL